jgi:hypothetical protein
MPLHLLSGPLPKRVVPFRGPHDAIVVSSMPSGGLVMPLVWSSKTGGVVRSATGVLLMTLLCRRAVGNDEIRIGLLSIPSAGALHFIEEPYLFTTVTLLLRPW